MSSIMRVCKLFCADTHNRKPSDMENVVIAYEPVWAIGTGLVCDADAAVSILRST